MNLRENRCSRGRYGVARLAARWALTALALCTGIAATASTGAESYRVIVSNEYAGTISIIDGGRREVIATLPVGKRPRGMQVSPDGGRLYVALSGSPPSPPWVDPADLPPADKSADGIGIVDLRSRELLRVVRGVSDPEQVVVSKDGGTLYVASEDTGQAVIQDAETGEVLASLPVGGEPEGMAISPDGSVVYVTSEEDHRVTVIDTADHRVVATFEVGRRPRAAAFSPDGRRAYVTGENDGTLTVVDATEHRVLERVTLPGSNPRPMGVAVAPDGSKVYVATGRGQSVVALDAGTLEILGSVPIGERPWGIATSPDGQFLFTANGPSDDVSVIDAGTLEELGRVEVDERPWGVVVAPPPQTGAPAGTYRVDPAHTSVLWQVDHLGLSLYTARFVDFDATLEFDPDDLAASRLEAVIDARSVRTDFPFPERSDFDQELVRSKHFFDAGDHPHIRFVSREIEMTGPRTGAVTGEMTLRGVTRPVTLDVRFNRGLAAHPVTGEPVVGFSAGGSIRRSAFGMNHLVPNVGDEVLIEIQAEFRPAPEDAEEGKSGVAASEGEVPDRRRVSPTS